MKPWHKNNRNGIKLKNLNGILVKMYIIEVYKIGDTKIKT